VLEGRLARPLEENVHHDAFGGSQDHVLDELLSVGIALLPWN
jgi:hypothetical protein